MNLKYKLHQVGVRVYFQVLAQDELFRRMKESESSLRFEASNGFFIVSADSPAALLGGLFLRGYARERDDVITFCTFLTESDAYCYVVRAQLALREWTANTPQFHPLDRACIFEV